MESRTRNTFVLLTVVFALQCVSADVPTTDVNPAAPNNSASGPLAPVNPAAKPAANPAPVVLSPSENVAKTEVAPLTNNNVSKHIVEIEVYYEALCSDSVTFVSNQLLPTYNKLSKFINVTFIPFAQGNITINPDKSAILKCKRNEVECAADKVHACGIHTIKDSEQLIKFVNCSLTEAVNNSSKTVPIEKCGKNSNIDSAIIAEITNCTNSTDSNLWLQEYMNKSTIAHVTNVPKVVINKNSTEDFASTVPFINAVCKQIPAELQPEDCKTVPSGSDTLVVGVLPIIIGAYYFIKMI